MEEESPLQSGVMS